MQERIIAVVVDLRLITLYREDGSSIEIPQGDPRVQLIRDNVIPVVDAGGVANVDLSAENSYSAFESQTSGSVKFFRAAKKLFGSIFDSSATSGNSETAGLQPSQHGKLPASKKTHTMPEAVDSIIAQSESVSKDTYRSTATPAENETMVAVVTDQKTGVRTAIPGMEKILGQLKYSARIGSTVGVQAFLARLAGMANKEFTVQELLSFLEKGDLPIADDGSIIAYKVLKTQSHTGRDHADTTFFDCHTGKIPQKVGSYVRMDDKLLDMNRRTECSHGLHIARRGYLGSFSGNVMTLVKIAPEDVMVVPFNEPNKMRVRGYDILFVLDDETAATLRRNNPMTDNEMAAQLLSRAIVGDHTARLQEVRIHDNYGNSVTVTPLIKGQKAQVTNPEPTMQLTTKHLATDDKTLVEKEQAKSAPIDPVAISKRQTAGKSAMPGSRQLRVNQLYEILEISNDPFHLYAAAKQLVELKKASKVYWDKLGIDSVKLAKILEIYDKGQPVAEALKPKAKPAPKQATPTPKVEAKPAEKPVEQKPGYGTVQQQARTLFAANNWTGLVALRKSKKKSWHVMGFNPNEIAVIKLHTGD